MLGAKSGFDSLEECFGELSPHIFAVETGLSSDPPMNRRIRSLDGVTLVSNSDLHSPANLGRNANVFFGHPSYDAMLDGLRAADPEICGGTVDLFPEEGKYHLDGHRECGVCLEPEESLALGNICPVCGKEVTIGVLHRVVELERKQTGRETPVTDKHLPHRYIIPLPELVGQVLGVGPSSKKIPAFYSQVLATYGSELQLLLDSGPDTLDALGELGNCIRAVREGRVIRKGGFDGQYGVIRADG
jgi:PHP family Zn ribbon phosphoesterase